MPFCDKVIAPVSFILRNANGHSDFFNGFPPDCRASDDLDHEFGDPAEASLAESLAYVRTGACSARSAGAAKRLATKRPIPLGDGWQQLLGAH